MPLEDDRHQLIRNLEEYQPDYPEEVEFKERFLELLSNYSNCFSRELLHAHITGSGWVVDKTQRFALMTHHTKLDKWLQLGGHADGDANILRVARREVEEESGLTTVRSMTHEIFDIDIHKIPERMAEPAHEHFDIRYLFTANIGEEVVKNEESNKIAWIPLIDLDNLTKSNRSILRMAEKTSHIKGKVSPLW